MSTDERNAGSPMPARLSQLWVFIMFNMVFADVLSFMYPGFLKEVLTGYVGGVHVTPGFLVAAAVLTGGEAGRASPPVVASALGTSAS